MENIKNLLSQILNELKKSNERAETPHLKEWHPLFFHIYAKGYYVYDKTFGSSKWGFRKIENKDILYDFDYEFHSLILHTEYRTYKPAIRLIINGKPFPDKQVFMSDNTTYDDWLEFTGHNYNYQRCYQFALIESYQSNHGYGRYPFKMTVKAPWTLNFEFFQTTTSENWHTLEIQGWKIYRKDKELMEELQEAIK